MPRDAVSLTKSLLRFDTVNPPGRERDCARHAGALLKEWGFRVDYHEYDERRTSVNARAGATREQPPMCLTGHHHVVQHHMEGVKMTDQMLPNLKGEVRQMAERMKAAQQREIAKFEPRAK